MHIVHCQDDRPTLGSALQTMAQNTQQVYVLDVVQIARQKVSERPEGKRPHRFGGRYPFDVVGCRPIQDLTNQARFSDSRPPGEEDSRSIRVRDDVGDEALLLGPPHQRPPVHAA